MLYGPHFSTFLNRPNTESSSYVMPISTSSDWMALLAPIGINSAEGIASRKLSVSLSAEDCYYSAPSKYRQVESCLSVCDELLQIRFRDAANWIHVGTAAADFSARRINQDNKAHSYLV